MGVYIDIEKPKDCWECFNYNCGHWGTHGYDFAETDCPLIELDLVRCVECKHYLGLAECEIIGECGGTVWFCAWGERRADE